jgi:hypothetical protein
LDELQLGWFSAKSVLKPVRCELPYDRPRPRRLVARGVFARGVGDRRLRRAAGTADVGGVGVDVAALPSAGPAVAADPADQHRVHGAVAE